MLLVEMAESQNIRLVCFFFNDTATTEIYTLSLHDALPIFIHVHGYAASVREPHDLLDLSDGQDLIRHREADRKSTRLNSSHLVISYAVFCLKKKTRPDHRCCPPPSHSRHVPSIRAALALCP